MAIMSSSILSITYTMLKDRQDINIEIDMKKNILKSLGTLTDEMSSEEIINRYEDIIDEIVIDMSGNIVNNINVSELVQEEDKSSGEIRYMFDSRRYLPAYTSQDSSAFIIPISGKGLWSTLYGYFAISNLNYSSVKGITFYKHGETPGLGAEVEEDWFQNQFKASAGKEIFNIKGELVSINVIKGKINNVKHEVDGISGATITSNGVTSFLYRDLNNYKVFFAKQING